MSNSVSSTSSLSQLQQLFPGVIQIDTRALAAVLGISAKTINNLGDKKFPIRAVRFGRSKFYRLVDAANYIDKSLGIEPSPTDTLELVTKPGFGSTSPMPKKKRGRPSHAELAERGHQSKPAKGRVA